MGSCEYWPRNTDWESYVHLWYFYREKQLGEIKQASLPLARWWSNTPTLRTIVAASLHGRLTLRIEKRRQVSMPSSTKGWVEWSYPHLEWWLHSTSSEQRVTVRGSTSQYPPVLSGVPQDMCVCFWSSEWFGLGTLVYILAVKLYYILL